jgi:mRNA interferase MazF
MVKILRGDIMWAELNPTVGNEQQGKRPVLVISHDSFNQYSGTVIAMALTSQPQKAGFPLTFPLDCAPLKKKAWVKISQIRTLSTQRLGKKIARIDELELEKIIEGINEIIA